MAWTSLATAGIGLTDVVRHKPAAYVARAAGTDNADAVPIRANDALFPFAGTHGRPPVRCETDFSGYVLMAHAGGRGKPWFAAAP